MKSRFGADSMRGLPAKILADLRLLFSFLVLGLILLLSAAALLASTLVLAIERRMHRRIPWGGGTTREET
jgi:hypothetical protein